ncbi:uncharacterized protein PG998_014389 [Apiospora kogelbergensis]|uniref:uncharacterized protein n=1 Tax=Apiospora kogelbergensis TaxID=1337665 RepID=UPI003131098C
MVIIRISSVMARAPTRDVRHGRHGVYLHMGIENTQTVRRKHYDAKVPLQSLQELYDLIWNRLEEDGFEIVRQTGLAIAVDSILGHIRWK